MTGKEVTEKIVEQFPQRLRNLSITPSIYRYILKGVAIVIILYVIKERNNFHLLQTAFPGLYETFLQISQGRNLPEATVEFELGTVVGKVSHRYRAFLGIPYAEPPTMENRWRLPRPLLRFPGGRFEATRYGKASVQHAVEGSFVRNILLGDISDVGEDCLNVNVYTPRLLPSKKEPPHPVFIFIHGGKFVSGGNSLELYCPKKLFQREERIVFVAPNYRLGVPGFLASRELIAEAKSDEERDAVGNYGIFDIVLAIEWTFQNIAAFGGDPQNITLVGQSAGAAAALLAYRVLLCRGKYFIKQLILHSIPNISMMLRRDAEEISQSIFNALACDSGCSKAKKVGGIDGLMRCLRNLPLEHIEKLVYERSLDFSFMPVVNQTIDWSDSEEVRLLQSVPVKNRARVVITTMQDDASLFIYNSVTSTYQSQFRTILHHYQDSRLVNRIMRHYRPEKFKTPFDAIAQAMTDQGFRTSNFSLYKAFKEAEYEVHYSELDFRLSIISMIIKWITKNDVGAFHGIDVFYFFGSRNYLLTAKERLIAERFRARILRFVQGGSFLEAGEPADQFSPLPEHVARCRFWDKNKFSMPVISIPNFLFPIDHSDAISNSEDDCEL